MNPQKTACFSGYPPEKFSFPLNGDGQYKTLIEDIRMAILYCIKNGYHTFLCGMGQGFDLLCGILVERLRRAKYHSIKLVAVVPYKGHARKWGGRWRAYHEKLSAVTDHTHYICEQYKQGCYQEQNRYMAGHSSMLVCYWDGKTGGTKHMVRYAEHMGLRIMNLATPAFEPLQ